MVILASKIYGDHEDRALQSLESMLANEFDDLDIELDIGVRHDGFPSVTVSGEDATVARNYLKETWGEIPGRLERGERYRGVLERWDEDGFVVDAGEEVVISPEALDLGQGDPDQIATRFGLVSMVPVAFIYSSPPRLTDSQRDRFYEWRRGPGRVTANGVTRGQLRATVNRAGHADDIRTIERLGILEQSIICADETDPPGLLASIGPYVEGELACVL